MPLTVSLPAGPPHRPMRSGRGLRTLAVPVNGGGEWLGKGCPQVLPGRTKPTHRVDPGVTSALCTPCPQQATWQLPPAPLPGGAPCSFFPASLPAPELPQGRELNPDQQHLQGCSHLGALGRAAQEMLVGTSEGVAGDRQSRGGSKKWSTKLSRVGTAKGTGRGWGGAER